MCTPNSHKALPPSAEPRLRNTSLGKESRGGLQSTQDEDCCDPSGGDIPIKGKVDNCLFRRPIAVTQNAHDRCRMHGLFEGSPSGCDSLWKLDRHRGNLSLKRVFISTNGDATRVCSVSGDIYIK